MVILCVAVMVWFSISVLCIDVHRCSAYPPVYMVCPAPQCSAVVCALACHCCTALGLCTLFDLRTVFAFRL